MEKALAGHRVITSSGLQVRNVKRRADEDPGYTGVYVLSAEIKERHMNIWTKRTFDKHGNHIAGSEHSALNLRFPIVGKLKKK